MLEVGLDVLGFVGKIATLLFGFGILLAIIAGSKGSSKSRKSEGVLAVRSLNDFYSKLHRSVEKVFMSKADLKAAKKADSAEKRKVKKEGLISSSKQKVYVLDFNGDREASAVHSLRHEVTAVLGHAKPTDEIVVRLESPGGSVDGYGLAASQLVRIRQAGIPLTICVDNVAASGGYLMSCVGSKIMCAPFAVLGSIGVVAQFPNINRLLKKHDIDVETITAGQHKRTLTFMGENTEEGRQKFSEDMAAVHQLFKSFVGEYRPQLDIDTVATGECWFGSDAINQKLADEIKTSDEYLQEKAAVADLLHVQYELPKKGGLKARLGFSVADTITDVLVRLANRRLG